MCYIKPTARTGACDRYGNRDGGLVARRPACPPRPGAAAGRRRRTLRAEGELGRRAWSRAAAVRHRDRRRHDLSRLQAGALHRLAGGRRRRHGHRGDRGHLQLLRRQGEDRHRPLSRAGDSHGARRRRGGRPRHHRRIRLADAVARRRAPPDRRLQDGGPRHLRGAARLCNSKPVELAIDGGATVDRQAGKPPDRQRRTSRSACASAAARPPSACSPRSGAARWTRWWWSTTTSPASFPSTRPASCWAWQDTGIKIKGRRSTPGRYFKVAQPGTGWGGTNIDDPLSILGPFDPEEGARPGLSLLMVSTTGEQLAYYELDDDAASRSRCTLPQPLRARSSASRRTASRRCRTVLFIGGAGGSLRGRRHRQSGAACTRSVQGRADLCHLRRRAGLCLAGRRHHASWSTSRACPTTPSATCRRRRWWRRSSSPCASTTIAALGGHAWSRSSRSPTSMQTGGEYLNPRRRCAAPRTDPGRRWRRPAAGRSAMNGAAGRNGCADGPAAASATTVRSTSIVEAFGDAD